jgi:hypothetical protein
VSDDRSNRLNHSHSKAKLFGYILLSYAALDLISGIFLTPAMSHVDEILRLAFPLGVISLTLISLARASVVKTIGLNVLLFAWLLPLIFSSVATAGRISTGSTVSLLVLSAGIGLFYETLRAQLGTGKGGLS